MQDEINEEIVKASIATVFACIGYFTGIFALVISLQENEKMKKHKKRKIGSKEWFATRVTLLEDKRLLIELGEK